MRRRFSAVFFEAYALVVRVRSASLAELRMRICYQNNGGSSISNISKSLSVRSLDWKTRPTQKMITAYTRKVYMLILAKAKTICMTDYKGLHLNIIIHLYYLF
jgi:hypothetical protein